MQPRTILWLKIAPSSDDNPFGFKVVRLAESMISIPFIMGYVVGLGLQNPELKILLQSDIWLLRY